LIPPLQPTSETPREQPVETHTENEQQEEGQRTDHQQPESFEKWDEYSALGAVDILSDLLEDDHTREYIDPAFRFGHKKKKKRRRPRL
jgi:relaxase/mobilisation nuclease domain